jgi:transposase
MSIRKVAITFGVSKVVKNWSKQQQIEGIYSLNRGKTTIQSPANAEELSERWQTIKMLLW